MAGRIRDDDMQAVKERTDLVKLASQYLTLKKAGADRLVGPVSVPPGEDAFVRHLARPSSSTTATAAGPGGDAIRFIRELEHLSYVEAVERLAQQAGVTLRYEGDSPEARRARRGAQALYRANEQAAELFTRMLADGKEATDAREYVQARASRPSRSQRSASVSRPAYPTSCCAGSARLAT